MALEAHPMEPVEPVNGWASMAEGYATAAWLRGQVLRDLTQALLYAVAIAVFAGLWIVLERRHPERRIGPSRETLVLVAVYVLSIVVGVLVIGFVGAMVVPEGPG